MPPLSMPPISQLRVSAHGVMTKTAQPSRSKRSSTLKANRYASSPAGRIIRPKPKPSLRACPPLSRSSSPAARSNSAQSPPALAISTPALARPANGTPPPANASSNKRAASFSQRKANPCATASISRYATPPSSPSPLPLCGRSLGYNPSPARVLRATTSSFGRGRPMPRHNRGHQSPDR